ncbi:MAG: hypothetical protein BWK80_32630 [Desulfobacteraceae bacterium IS3]|nr:MAG: hypothetical protein BWK80_32630 [Desulfobacteraceae bacterium IS3]
MRSLREIFKFLAKDAKIAKPQETDRQRLYFFFSSSFLLPFAPSAPSAPSASFARTFYFLNGQMK